MSLADHGRDAGSPPDWPALDEALSGPKRPRVPFWLGDALCVGSVAIEHLDALRGEAPHLHVDDSGVRLRVEPARRTEALERINQRLRDRGLIRAWRDEPYAVVEPGRAEVLATIERAASRFWGTLTFGAHANGFVRDAQGRIAQVWIAQRSPHKATDPGLFDNLVGGGVPLGQTPRECLLREGFEEAGLPGTRMQAALPGRRLRIVREIPEGFQHEWLCVFDLELAPDEEPRNQDGEVASFTRMPLHEAFALAAGPRMTVDASLVMLDFALRHRLLPAQQCDQLEARAAALWVAG